MIVTLIVQKRHTLILDHLGREQAISIKELSDLLNASRETIRKDIALLSKEGLLRQVRGGAVRSQSAEATLAERSIVNPSGKQAMARLLARLIPDGACLIIDSGTTTQAAAREIAQHRRDLSIRTNDLTVASILAPVAREILLLGGKLDRNEHCTSGLDTLEMLGRHRADYALIGVGGLSEQDLFTDFSSENAAMRDRMIQVSDHPILLADQSKIGVVAPVHLTRVDGRAMAITDAPLPAGLSSLLMAIGMTVRIAA